MEREAPTVIAGTCGYDYPEWVGADLFYPPRLARDRRDWLTYYASQFPAVELDFTHYGEAKPAQFEGMLKRTDPRQQLVLLEGTYAPLPAFTFFVKAYASLTHSITQEWRTAARRFVVATAPLREAGKLAGVLAQFPSRLPCTGELVSYILELADEVRPVQLIVEFRHRRWFTAQALGKLVSEGTAVCGVDAPTDADLPSFIEDGAPAVAPLVEGAAKEGSQLAYVRLHGRRADSWWSGDAASRYEYRYAPSQLTRLAERLLQQPVEKAYVLFNNHRHADAAKNARQLQEIVRALLQGRASAGAQDSRTE